MSTAKTLMKTGSSFISRLLAKQSQSQIHQTLQQHRVLVAPQLSNHLDVASFQLRQHDVVAAANFEHDAEALRRVKCDEIVYPCGLPSLEFYCPEGNISSDDAMILFPKRTFQPSTIRRKRTHGFFARKATKGGRKVIARRIAKGRQRVTA